MPLPLSRNQIEKLGRRLAAGAEITDTDLGALEDLVACHMSVLELARPRLDGLAEAVGTTQLHITHRAKTTQTIIEKLRRQDGMSLARMQDLAGIRVVGAISLTEQDALTAEIARRFPADPREPVIKDRREEPSYGYKAVHVIVSLDAIAVEVQVRTLLQHVWANVMERLADLFGRQIRYGEPPTPPDGFSLEAAQGIVAVMMRLSERFAEMQLNVTEPGGETPMPVEEATRRLVNVMIEELTRVEV
jgi:ppGpp synthetase/RelA/SpoT-type nucleotidyltranferase